MLPGCFPLVLLFILVLPFLFLLFYLNVVTFSFAKLGLSPGSAGLLLLLTILGSVINIPVSRTRFVAEEPIIPGLPFIFYSPPRVQEQVIAVNVGGAVIPALVALYVLPQAPLLPVIASAAVVTWVTNRLAKPVPGLGIRIPPLIPPLVAALCALLLAPNHAPSVAFIAGVLGTLIGADLLNLHLIRDLGAQVVSIGGAGIYDGIFLVGIVAALLT